MNPALWRRAAIRSRPSIGHADDRTVTLVTAVIRICALGIILIALPLPQVAQALALIYVIVVFTALGLFAGATVPLVLKCTKRLYTANLIGVGASANTTAAGLFIGIAQPIIGFAMLALLGILLLMSLPGITGPLLMKSGLTIQ